MADAPLSAPVIGIPGAPKCPRCGWNLMVAGLCLYCDSEIGRAMRAPLRPTPTFNHTRSDGPFDPCPECAALMGPASREALYRDLICCLLDQMGEMMVSDGHDCETNGRFPCCKAWRFLVATKGLQPERPRRVDALPPLPAGGQIGRAP